MILVPGLITAGTADVETVVVSGKIQVALVDLFDDGDDVNLLGGAMGVMPDSPPTRTFDGTVIQGSQGRSLRLDYNLGSVNPGWGGFWMKLSPQANGTYNASSYRYLSLWARSLTSNHNPETFKVEVKSTGGTTNYTVNGLGLVWTNYVLDLDAAGVTLNKAQLTEVNIVLERATAVDPVGVLFIDTLMFRNN